jgi:hypothetical protein
MCPIQIGHRSGSTIADLCLASKVGKEDRFQYKRLLASETDPDKREVLNRQLAEQEAKLQEMEGKERGG